MAALSGLTARIDFSDAHMPDGPRLRHAFGTSRQTLVARHLAQVRPVRAWDKGYV